MILDRKIGHSDPIHSFYWLMEGLRGLILDKDFSGILGSITF